MTQGITAPALANGSVYTVAGPQLIKLNAQTGAQQWHVAIPEGIYDSVAVAAGLVIVHGNDCISQSAPGEITSAYSADTGAQVWGANALGYDGHMVVSNGYVATGAPHGAEGAEPSYSIYKLATGALLWSISYACDIDGRLLVVDTRVVYSACTAGGAADLEARSLTTGALAWSLPGHWAPLMGDSDTASGRHLFAGGPGGLYDIDPQSGNTGPALTGVGSLLAVGPARYISLCGEATACGYSLTTHALQWRSALDQGSTVAALANSVLFLDSGLVLNSTNGARLTTIWSEDGPSPKQLVVGDGRIGAVSDFRVLDIYGLPGS